MMNNEKILTLEQGVLPPLDDHFVQLYVRDWSQVYFSDYLHS